MDASGRLIKARGAQGTDGIARRVAGFVSIALVRRVRKQNAGVQHLALVFESVRRAQRRQRRQDLEITFTRTEDKNKDDLNRDFNQDFNPDLNYTGFAITI